MSPYQRLIWIDLEMTGLDAGADTILELAMIITDGNLNILHEGPELVIHQSEKTLDDMGPWVKNQHTKSGLVEKVRNSKISLDDAQDEVLEVLQQYCEPRKAILAGNTIWKDREFLDMYMPDLTAFLHYRMLDVTSIKVVITNWFPNYRQHTFEKQDNHRAMDDIRESIQELEHYRKYFFVDELEKL